MFGRAVLVEHLMEELITVPVDAGLAAACDKMTALSIDVIGATDGGGRVVGYFARDGLHSFTGALTTSDSLKDALAALRESARVFVRAMDAHAHVVGIVTRADLQKPPFRLYCFGLITLLEMHVLDRIRAHHRDDASWLPLLSDGRGSKCRELFADRARRGLEISLDECLQLADKRDIVVRTPALRDELGFASNGACKSFFDDVQKIRDDLAHGQQLDGGRTWSEVISRMLEIERVLVRERYSSPPVLE